MEAVEIKWDTFPPSSSCFNTLTTLNVVISAVLSPSAVVFAYEHLYTSAFWCDFCDQVLHCDVLQTLFSDHICTHKSEVSFTNLVFSQDWITYKHTHTKTKKYLCSVLSADPSIHTPPALPWATLSTCSHTLSWHYISVSPRQSCLLTTAERITAEEKDCLPLPLPHFYQLLVYCSPHLGVFAHDLSQIKLQKQQQGQFGCDYFEGEYTKKEEEWFIELAMR